MNARKTWTARLFSRQISRKGQLLHAGKTSRLHKENVILMEFTPQRRRSAGNHPDH